MPKNLNIFVFGGTYTPKSDLIFKINDHIKEEITNLKGERFSEYGTRLTAHTRSDNIYIYQLEAGQLGAYDKDFPNDFNKTNWEKYRLNWHTVLKIAAELPNRWRNANTVC
jgi:hypothetical protein